MTLLLEIETDTPKKSPNPGAGLLNVCKRFPDVSKRYAVPEFIAPKSSVASTPGL